MTRAESSACSVFLYLKLKQRVHGAGYGELWMLLKLSEKKNWLPQDRKIKIPCKKFQVVLGQLHDIPKRRKGKSQE